MAQAQQTTAAALKEAIKSESKRLADYDDKKETTAVRALTEKMTVSFTVTPSEAAKQIGGDDAENVYAVMQDAASAGGKLAARPPAR